MRQRSREATVLAVACIAQFMVVLDISVVNVALPSGCDSLSGPRLDGLTWPRSRLAGGVATV
ncbi:hypothetical protein TPAU25S_04114 [Tsukamurella paurometabola]|nr:Uncharacterised protein [Tsukamurella paurometabola]